MKKRNHDRIVLRRLAATVLGLWIGGFAVHFGLVSHRVCAAHGDLIHGDDHHEGASANTDIPAVGTHSASDHGHDACAVWLSLERTDPTQGPGLDVPPLATVIVLLPDVSFAPPVTRWLVAPKTSPPIA